MPAYKLTYFNLSAWAEPIRFIFAQAGVPFEDNRVPFEQWPRLKSERLPMLEEDNKVVCNFPIDEYLAKNLTWLVLTIVRMERFL